WSLDSLNPKIHVAGEYTNSVLMGKDYVLPTETEFDAAIAHGKLDTIPVDTNQWPLCHNLVIYTPPGYATDSLSYPAAYFHDGDNQLGIAAVPNVLDNLIAAGKIQPTIAVFLEPNDRNLDYAFDRRMAFADFVAQQLVPFVDQSFRTIDDPAQRATIGASFGGLISAIIAYQHPDVFGNCGIHSGAFWPNDDWGVDFVRERMDAPVKYAAIWGSYEGVGKNNQAIIDAFAAKDKEVLWRVLPEGHSWGLWKATTDDFLIHFFPVQP
ncbi:MAG: alpha/beta hydrolase-fold protein, partial [Bacteroidota bacterium]